jgi:phosphate transport system protein
MVELRKQFHHQLQTVSDELIRIGASVVEAIPRATHVLLDQDLEGAEYLVRSDDEIDSRSIDLEERCFELLALQAPVATDLRSIIATIKIIGELERSADLCVNISKAARRIYGHELNPKLRGLLHRMGEQAQFLMATSVESYNDRNASKAAALDDMDSYLDGLQREFVQAIFESHAEQGVDLQVAVQLAMIARFYERIGDHAVNIGERVRYMVTGWVPEHAGAARYRAGAAAGETDPAPADGAPPAPADN